MQTNEIIYVLIIIIFSISCAINTGLGVLRIRSLRLSPTKLLQSFDFKPSYKYQKYNLLFNIVRDGISSITMLMFVLFKAPAYFDSMFLKINLSENLSDVFTMALLLLASIVFMFVFESIKHSFLKARSFNFFPPTKKLLSLWSIRFFLIIVPMMVYIISFNSLHHNSDKVVLSFFSTLITGVISFNIYTKLTYTLDKSHIISINNESGEFIISCVLSKAAQKSAG